MTGIRNDLDQRQVRTNQIRLHVIQAGPEDGGLVILLHGFPEFWWGWRQQITPLAEAGYRVIVPDQRGYNESDKPQGVAAYRLDELAADIVGLIQDYRREKAAIIGHDWGGVVAWALAIWHPERVERLGILNVPHPAVMKRTLLRSTEQKIRSLYALFFQLPFLPEAVLRNNNWELLEKVLRDSSEPGTFSDRDLELYRQAWWRQGAFTSMLNWYRAVVRFPPRLPSEARVHVPTLMIWGVHDVALSRKMAQASIELCDRGQLVLFEDATHWVQHERPEKVNRLLIQFLGKGREQIKKDL